jgi:subtilisin family serine protease
VAVIDSGVHPGHPHVPHVDGGIAFDEHANPHGDIVDRIGHGTAVAAAIVEKAPEAALSIVKVFDRELVATGDVLVAALRWAIAQPVDIVNLSLGTLNAAHESLLARVVADAGRHGLTIVAAAPDGDRRWLPGALPGVVAAEVDWNLPRDVCELMTVDGSIAARASGYPRPIPGLAPERNLRGVSFAVANVTGLLVLAHEARTWPFARASGSASRER